MYSPILCIIIQFPISLQAAAPSSPPSSPLIELKNPLNFCFFKATPHEDEAVEKFTKK